MKKITIIILLFLSINVFAQNTYIPDDNFEQELINLGVDTVLDDSVFTGNINTLKILDIEGKSIADLTGIADFVVLETLYCSDNNLSSLDLSANVNLKIMSCSENQITSLNVDSCSLLTELYCRDNKLTSIDVSHNLNLQYFGCQDNLLTNLDVSKNTALLELYLYQNQISAIDISANTSLTSLNCFSNLLTDLDLHLNTALVSIICDDNQLTSLGLSVNTALMFLDCHDNSLIDIDLSYNTSFISLRCNDNPNLTSVNIQNGNNSNIIDFQAQNCSKLKCIYVDDKTATYLNTWTKDAASTYVETDVECAALPTIEGTMNDNFMVYPNPAQEKIVIQSDNLVKTVKIYDIFGKLVKVYGNQGNYSVSELKGGTYLIRVETNNAVKSSKLIVE